MRSSGASAIGLAQAPRHANPPPVLQQFGAGEIRMGFPPGGELDARASGAFVETGVQIALDRQGLALWLRIHAAFSEWTM